MRKYKLLALISALLLVFSLFTGCGKKDAVVPEESVVSEVPDETDIDLESVFDEQKDEHDESDVDETSKATLSVDVSESEETEGDETESKDTETFKIDKDGRYTSKDEVALYIHTYGELPKNYITKDEARDSGWVASEGNLWDVTDEMSIGGDVFSNREQNLPIKKGRKYFEADIDYEGGRRNAKRIVFSNDGLVFYTDDHYETFEEIKKPDEVNK